MHSLVHGMRNGQTERQTDALTSSWYEEWTDGKTDWCTHWLSPRESPPRGGDVAVFVSDINQPTLPAPFYSVLVSISVFMVLSNVFHSINSPDNFPFSHSVRDSL